METLFVLRKKFCSSRVVRIIYEFADERKYWLKQYRHAIHNGHTIVPSSKISFGSQGVLSAFLMCTPLYIKTKGNTYYRSRNKSHHLKGRLFVLLNNLEKMDILYVTPVTMNKYDERGCYKFSSQMLYENCIENSCSVDEYKFSSRKTLIRKLMKI